MPAAETPLERRVRLAEGAIARLTRCVLHLERQVAGADPAAEPPPVAPERPPEPVQPAKAAIQPAKRSHASKGIRKKLAPGVISTAERIQQINDRVKLGMKPEQIAEEIGLARSTVVELMRGRATDGQSYVQRPFIVDCPEGEDPALAALKAHHKPLTSVRPDLVDGIRFKGGPAARFSGSGSPGSMCVDAR